MQRGNRATPTKEATKNMEKIFTLELIRTRKQRNIEPTIEVFLVDSINFDSVVGVREDIENHIRVYGIDELASSLMNQHNHYRTATGVDLDVTEVFTKGKTVTIVLKGGLLEVQVVTAGRISVQAIVD